MTYERETLESVTKMRIRILQKMTGKADYVEYQAALRMVEEETAAYYEQAAIFDLLTRQQLSQKFSLDPSRITRALYDTQTQTKLAQYRKPTPPVLLLTFARRALFIGPINLPAAVRTNPIFLLLSRPSFQTNFF